MDKEVAWLLKEKYHGEKTAGFFADCALLAAGKPLAFLIGSIPFLNATISLDSEPLIPRPETEFWVEKAITTITERGLVPLTVLDMCAGSGCIGVAVAQAVTVALVDFGEIDARHHPTIQKNLRNNGLDESKSKIFSGDLFENITGSYDFILSNPPYIDPALDRTEDSVRNYEPAIALYGGKAGLNVIERLIVEAPQYLNPKGELWLEHEPEQVARIALLGEQNGFTVYTNNDQFGTPRFSRLVLKLSIWNQIL